MQDIFEYKDCITPVKAIPSINIYGVDKVGDRKPTFTIAIPTYKRPRTLGETIESALNQEDFDDYNIIVVDNNPERGDETEVFMQKYKDHPKVTYYKNSENVGMAGNWNKCAILSDAEQIILLHDDDLLIPSTVSSFNVMLKNISNNWAVIKPQLSKFDRKENLKIPLFTQWVMTKMHEIDYLFGDAINAPTCILFNKVKYIEAGGANQNFYPSYDFALSYSLKHIGDVYLSNRFLGGYRVGINESLSSKTMNMFFDFKVKKSIQIMKRNYIPTLLRKILLSSVMPLHLKWTKEFYNMNDYDYDFSSFGFTGVVTKSGIFVCRIYHYVKRLVNHFSQVNIA